MRFFMTELRVGDFEAALAWYQKWLGESCVEHIDRPKQFALFQSGTNRLAIKAGMPSTGDCLLHFEVDNLENEIKRLGELGIAIIDGIKPSDEGYRRIKIADPDGRVIVLFQRDSISYNKPITRPETQ